MMSDTKPPRSGMIPYLHARAGGDADMYQTDFSRWAMDQASILRGIARGPEPLIGPDWDNLAEEIEALAKDRFEKLARRIRTIMVHLVKLEISPSNDPKAGWRSTVRRSRANVERMLEGDRTLREHVGEIISKELIGAIQDAHDEIADYG